ncbi:MAG: superfamily II DNA/RNA helicase [Polyangiales bacterium]|jgi:superfamily II DNA/RNA helicase
MKIKESSNSRLAVTKLANPKPPLLFNPRRRGLNKESARGLYDDVTEYLLDPVICAFRGNQRQLLLIGFHRRMASSVPALTASLSKVAERLEKMLEGASEDETETAAALLDDLEEEERDIDDDAVSEESRAPSPEMITAELERVREFVARATSLPSDAKAHALVRAVRTVLKQGEAGEGSGKVVIFTESITTQNYLREVLCESGLLTDQDVTLFRGTNDGARAREAVERWREEELPNLPKTAHPSADIAVRLALVHEFRTRSKVFISTEAGAKGLNLQFAGTLINYDLPWNPQRIEQRIGRIHRYGQTKDVLVINFAARGDEAQKLTLEILS